MQKNQIKYRPFEIKDRKCNNGGTCCDNEVKWKITELHDGESEEGTEESVIEGLHEATDEIKDMKTGDVR